MMKFIHQIQESPLCDIRGYFQPEKYLEYCKACQHYGKIWACPPYEFNTEQVLEGHQYVYIIGSKLYIRDLCESYKKLVESKDLEHATTEIYKAARAVLDEKLVRLEDGSEQLSVLLAGRCLVCQPCTRQEQQPCLYPEKMNLSLESIGFDVASICEDILHDKILWAKEALPEYFLLVSAVLSKERLEIDKLYRTLE